MFAQFRAVAYTIWLLAHLAGEVGFEPTFLLVTSIRLRGVKKGALREWKEVIFVSFSELMSFH